MRPCLKGRANKICRRGGEVTEL